jgi:glycerol uptake facilitator-like aquaporin
MIYTLGDISGAHLNPAVTFGFFIARRLRGGEALPYVVSQCLGAIIASCAVRLVFAQKSSLGSTVPSGSAMQSFVLETILTALLMFVVLGVSTGAREKGITAGIAVGSVIALAAIFGRANLRRIDESCAVSRAGARVRSVAGAVDLPFGAN